MNVEINIEELLELLASGNQTDNQNALSAIEQAVSKHNGALVLFLNKLTDLAADAISKNQGALSLNVVDRPSDEALQALARHHGDLELNGYGFEELTDIAAEALGSHAGGDLLLRDLRTLSESGAQSLAKHQGRLVLDGLGELSDAAAEALAKHEGVLELIGDLEMSDAALEFLSKKHPEVFWV
jgi:hypothetical protein